MRKYALAAVLLALGGCAQVDNYQEVVKAPAPAGLAGYWQSQGPQGKLVSPEAIASLIVTEQGDTLDCRQWQRVIALPGKLMQRGDDWYSVTRKVEIYALERHGDQIDYAGMALQRVAHPTKACADYLAAHPLLSPLP